MEISYQCGQCGRWYTANERSTGKTVKCSDCGAAVKVPPAPDQLPGDMEAYGLPEMDPNASSSPGRRGPELQGAASRSANATPADYGKAKEKPSNSKSFFGGGLGTIGVLVLLAIRVYFRWERNQARQAQRNNQAVVVAPVEAGTPAPSQNVAPWKMPALPPPSAAKEIEPGVMFSEIKLGTNQPAGTLQPGHGGKIWLYLPAGEHAPKSLPCILIAAAGSNLITGMELAGGDRPEHLPYAQAGFAVLAYPSSSPALASSLHGSTREPTKRRSTARSFCSTPTTMPACQRGPRLGSAASAVGQDRHRLECCHRRTLPVDDQGGRAAGDQVASISGQTGPLIDHATPGPISTYLPLAATAGSSARASV